MPVYLIEMIHEFIKIVHVKMFILTYNALNDYLLSLLVIITFLF